MVEPEHGAIAPNDRQSKPSKVTPVVTGVLVALIPACIGYGVAFLNEIRKSDLYFVNSQIEHLYGPLYALTQANNAT